MPGKPGKTGEAGMLVETLGKPPGAKLIRLRAELEGDRIRTIRILGDFFASPEEGFDRLEERLAGTALADLASSFDALLREEDVEAFGISGAGVASVLASALPGKGEGNR
jgi:hypothetical protein